MFPFWLNVHAFFYRDRNNIGLVLFPIDRFRDQCHVTHSGCKTSTNTVSSIGKCRCCKVHDDCCICFDRDFSVWKYRHVKNSPESVTCRGSWKSQNRPLCFQWVFGYSYLQNKKKYNLRVQACIEKKLYYGKNVSSGKMFQTVATSSAIQHSPED